MLASLSAYRHKSAADPARRRRIAYLCPVEFKDEGDDNTILRGLRERANELGYGLETFFWQRSPEDLARKLRMCRACGIRGIIVQARGDSVGGWPVHLSGFAVVLIGGDPGDVYRSVVSAYFENARRATAHLLDAGYRRVGLLLPDSTPAHVLDRYRTGYLVAAICASVVRLPPMPACCILSIEKQVGIGKNHGRYCCLRVTGRKRSTSKSVSKSCSRRGSMPAFRCIRLASDLTEVFSACDTVKLD